MFTSPEQLASAPAREFIRLCRDAVILIDAEFKIRLWNEAAEKLYGWTAAEAMGRNGTELLRTEFPGGDRVARLKAIQETGFYRGEGIQATKDGLRIPVEIDSMALKEPEGAITGYLSFNRDIRARKREAEKLAEYRLFLETLANNMPGMVGYWGSDLRCGFANQAYREWFGRDPVSMIGMHIRELLGDEIYALNEPYIRGALSGSPQRFERTLTPPGGSTRYSLAHYVPHFRDGRVAGFFVLVSDLTAQKQAEIRLQDTLDIQKALSENTAFALIQGDTEGVIRFINPAAAQLLGYAPEELVGKQTPAIFHDPGEVAARAEEFSRELGRPVAIGFETFVIKSILGLPNEHEWTYVRKDGERVPVLLGVTAIRDSAGRITGFLGTAADITKSKRLEDELRQAISVAEAANRAKSEFLATMSHEIRTPLNGVLGLAQILLDTDLSPEQREYVRVMSQSGGLLLSIINDILDYSKIEAGKMELETEDFELGPAIEEVANILSLRAQEKGLYLRKETSASGPCLAVGDPGKVRQILMNLVGNAVKFTERGGVEIRASMRDGAWRIEVSDTGIGIPDDARERVFRKFSQADASTTRKFGGTGLGLAISKALAEMMSGSLSFSSDPGQGSTFCLVLPAAAEEEDAPPTGKPDRPAAGEGTERAGFAGLRMLVVEDNAVNRMVAAGLFRKIGCEVEMAGDGREALAKLRESGFDAVFMDCQMPVMDGFEATRLIRAWEAGRGGDPHVLIIALTANAFADDRKRCLAAGMDDFVTKPLRKADIVRALSSRFPSDRDAGA